MPRRDNGFYVRMTASESVQLRRLSRMLDMSMSAYVRKAAFHPREIVARLEWPEFKKELEAIFLEKTDD